MPSTLETYYSGSNQKTKLQLSTGTDRDKQEHDGKTRLHSRRVRKKKDCISKIDRSQFSKHLAFHSRHKHQNKQCGTNLQKSIFWYLPNLPFQEANNSITLYGIT